MEILGSVSNLRIAGREGRVGEEYYAQDFLGREFRGLLSGRGREEGEAMLGTELAVAGGVY